MALEALDIPKISPLDTPNYTFIRLKDVSDYVYETFKHFFQTNQYNGFGGLLLMSLDNVEKEMDEFRDSNSQLRCCINDLKASCSHRNEIAEKQIQISSCNWLTDNAN